MNAPDKVKLTFEKLKEEYKFYIVLEFINGRYYVYRHQGIWDKENKKRKTKSEYLGKINNEGIYIRKASTKEDKSIETSKAIIEAHGGKIIWPSYEETSGFTPEKVDEKILTELSVNARQSAKEIGKKIGISAYEASRRIKELEKELGIQYTIDATLEQFHHYQFIAIAKFVDERPDLVELKKLLESDPRIRLVLSTRGAYDLFIFMFAQGPLEAEEIIYKLRSSDLLAKCKASWNVTYHSQAHGFIPFRDKFFDIVKERVWKREKGGPKKRPEQFFFREYATMRELNQNSRMQFDIIDQKHDLKGGSARYTYNNLIETGSIRGPTITMDKPPVKGTAIFVLEQIDIDEFNRNKKEYYEFVLKDETLLNKFIFVGDIGSPYGGFFIAPTYKNRDTELLEAGLLQSAKGSKIFTSIVSDIIIGNLGYRKVDTKHTHLYEKMLENAKRELKNP